ncbi:MAG: hypothetical protein ACK52U_13535 [Synechococcaceae cyanobacterium]|jgi:hypothetical protein
MTLQQSRLPKASLLADPGLRRPRRRPSWMWTLVVLGLGLGALELALRGLGLGHPPLFVADRQMEYRFRPNQTLRRFGHPIQINQWGMRSTPLSPRPTPGKRRLLVLGDSITWGGAVTDQDRIAISRLQRQLGPSWEVANLATPSWGPANWLGAVRRFGLLGARQVLLVMSTHDALDDPTYDSLEGNPETPSQDPPLALIELWQRYLLPRLRQHWPPAGGGPADPMNPSVTSATAPARDDKVLEPRALGSVLAPGSDSRRPFDTLMRRTRKDPRHPNRPLDLLLPLPALDALIDAVEGRGAQLVVLQFWERGEVESGRPWPDHNRITALLQRRGVPITQAGPILRQCATAHGQPIAALYVDPIHPYTDLGQRCLAVALQRALRPLAGRSS